MDEFDKQKIKLLEEYFLNQRNIAFAFLFGSRLKKSHPGSDWDIGVYFKPSSGSPEWENGKAYPEEENIFAELTGKLRTDNIDLIVLNRCATHLADTIVRKGSPIVIKNRTLYLEFLLSVSQEAEDYRTLMSDYYQIYQRSGSLSEEDKVSLQRRVIFLENELKDFSYYKNFVFSDYRDNLHKKREMERWIENIVNAILDISKIVLSSHKSEMPETYRDTIENYHNLICHRR